MYECGTGFDYVVRFAISYDFELRKQPIDEFESDEPAGIGNADVPQQQVGAVEHQRCFAADFIELRYKPVGTLGPWWFP